MHSTGSLCPAVHSFDAQGWGAPSPQFRWLEQEGMAPKGHLKAFILAEEGDFSQNPLALVTGSLALRGTVQG